MQGLALVLRFGFALGRPRAKKMPSSSFCMFAKLRENGRNSEGGDLIITRQWIDDNMSKRGGGWKRCQLAAIGVSWPPQRGWKERSIGLEISEEQRRSFEAFRGYSEVKDVQLKLACL
jgi:hypothetical protein